jgi:CRISPR-associated protein Csa1
MGLFPTIDDAVSLFQRIQMAKIEVSEELRGWKHSDYPLRPPSSSKISVGDLSLEFCRTGRLFFLRYVQKTKEVEKPLLARGKYIHSVFSAAITTAKRIILSESAKDGSSFLPIFQEEGIKVKSVLSKEFDFLSRSEGEERIGRLFDKIWGMAANTYSYQLDKTVTRSPYLSLDGIVSSVVPVLTEFPLDGTSLGFQKSIRVDALVLPSLIVEVKTREVKQEHKIGLAAYAMIFESLFSTPVDYALILNLRLDKEAKDMKVYEELVPISDSLRTATIERRDVALKIVDDGIDPGKPDSCSKDCPYYEACNRQIQ